jgi:MoaA/NifB/PqqE/SkfB family radical SAM enzyme
MIENILDDVPTNIDIVMLGGELTLHPNIEAILELFNQKKRTYMMVSNGIKADYLEFLVNKYRVPNLELSCDGTWEAYKRSRGIDNYDNIILLLKKLQGKTQLHISYVISEWNNREELLKISQLCKKYNAILHIDCRDEIPFYDTTIPKIKKIYKADDVASYPHNKLLRLYNKWGSGNLKIPCYANKYICSIFPNGDVYGCDRRFILLGNLNTQSLSAIRHSPNTIKIQDELANCNDCFAPCYRAVDIAISSLIPKFVKL